MKAFDYLVFIGRFQPLHRGHLAIIEAGLAAAEHLVVLCGSAGQPRSLRNPWRADERAQMIRDAVAPTDHPRLHIAPLIDRVYNDQRWISTVQAAVGGVIEQTGGADDAKVGLIGHSKDASSYYLNLFPGWQCIDVANVEGISATNIRATFIDSGRVDTALLPPAVAATFFHN